MPAEFVASLPAALTSIEAGLVPAGAKDWAVFHKLVSDFIDRYRLGPASNAKRSDAEVARDTKGLAQDYQSVLAYLPPDLLRTAFERLRATYTNGFRPPLPAEIGATVEAEFLARAHLRSQITLAIGHSRA